MDNSSIGKKIRFYRKSQGLKIKELAEMTNLTSSMLSQIERGLANPSINTLSSLSQALNVAVFQFFIEESSNSENLIVTPENRIKIIPPKVDETGVTYELLVPNLNGSIEFTILTLQPGCQSNITLTSHIGEEVNYLLSGTLKLYYKDKIYYLNEGDSIRIPKNTPHMWCNISDKEAKLIFASTPTSF